MSFTNRALCIFDVKYKIVATTPFGHSKEFDLFYDCGRG